MEISGNAAYSKAYEGEGPLYVIFATVVALPTGPAVCGYLNARPLNVSKCLLYMQNTITHLLFVRSQRYFPTWQALKTTGNIQGK